MWHFANMLIQMQVIQMQCFIKSKVISKHNPCNDYVSLLNELQVRLGIGCLISGRQLNVTCLRLGDLTCVIPSSYSSSVTAFFFNSCSCNHTDRVIAFKDSSVGLSTGERKNLCAAVTFQVVSIMHWRTQSISPQLSLACQGVTSATILVKSVS